MSDPRPAAAHPAPDLRRPRLTAPGILLGVGLGGFVDGILLHQVLQWHHMLTSTDSDHVGVADYPADTLRGLEVNTLWDGFFHAFTWVMVVVGLVVLNSRIRRAPRRTWSARELWGWVLVGWGVFNLGEGVLNHHVLGIHHVRSGPHELAYDLGFLTLGAGLVVVGWLVQRAPRPVSR